MTNILAMRVDILDHQSVITKVLELIATGSGSYVCVSNVHMCMEVFDSLEFRKIVNDADLVVADGRPIYWAQKLLGAKEAAQVRGQDLMQALCELSVDRSLRIGLYGGASDELLEKTVEKLKSFKPGIEFAYTYSPPFRPLTPSEDARVVQEINDANVDILFVGIGCPKQERWMAAHRDSVNCVMVGVGAAFDFICGSKRHAPKFMQTLGLEWLFRLASEPKRLASRYLIQNPRFLYHFSLQWLLGKRY